LKALDNCIRPPCSQKNIDAIAAVRDEFLKIKPPSLPHLRNPNLIDEAPLFSEDDEFDSESCTLTAHFEDPPKLIFEDKSLSLIVSVSLPKGVTLADPEHVQSALSKLHSRVKYYTNSTTA
jgi:hypothetical protein